MLLVRAGLFMMGSNDGMADEYPAHTVRLDDFYIDRYEFPGKNRTPRSGVGLERNPKEYS